MWNCCFQGADTRLSTFRQWRWKLNWLALFEGPQFFKHVILMYFDNWIVGVRGFEPWFSLATRLLAFFQVYNSLLVLGAITYCSVRQLHKWTRIWYYLLASIACLMNDIIAFMSEIIYKWLSYSFQSTEKLRIQIFCTWIGKILLLVCCNAYYFYVYNFCAWKRNILVKWMWYY